jgi:protein ImuB
MTALALATPSPVSADAPIPSGERRNRLWLCCHLPRLPLEVALKAVDDRNQPIAVFEQVKSRPQLLMATTEAQSQGIHPGLGINAALALCPHIQLMPRNPEGEHQALTALAEHCLRHYTSWVSLNRPQSLLLEVQGSLKLHGGLDALLNRVSTQVSHLGHQCVLATSPASFASWLLASQGLGRSVADREELRSALGTLPIEALGLSDRLIRRLNLAGVHQLRDLWRLPREGLIRRYGMELALRRDQALGLAVDLPDEFTARPRFRAALDMPMESREIAHCWPLIERLLVTLMEFLGDLDGAITGLLLTLFHPGYTPATALTLELRKASRDPSYISLLLREKLDRSLLPAPVRSIALASDQIHRFVPETPDLFGHRLADSNEWESLLETLQARLGPRALKFFASREDDRPERAFTLGTRQTGSQAVPGRRRPLWLLPKSKPAPSRLIFEGEVERIESGWWDHSAIRRDYRIARDQLGRRWWAYRDLSRPGNWQLQGLYG